MRRSDKFSGPLSLTDNTPPQRISLAESGEYKRNVYYIILLYSNEYSVVKLKIPCLYTYIQGVLIKLYKKKVIIIRPRTDIIQ